MKIMDRLFEIMTTKRKVGRHKGLDVLLAKCESLGINVVFEPYSYKRPTANRAFGWDGKGTLRINSRRSGKRVVFDIAHELAHWMCATPARRGVIEFGLGAGFSTDDVRAADKARRVSRQTTTYEEEAVCILAGLILYEIGQDVLKESELVSFIEEGDWPQRGEAKLFEKLLKNLIRWGMVSKDLELTWQPRQAKDILRV